MATAIRFRGSGPGAQTLDGSSVEFLKLLPAGIEPSLIASAVPARGSILELGAGVGRITHPLVALGYNVTAVDNSPEMLAEIHGAVTVLSDIEELSLGRSFDAVLLGSFLIHAPVPGTRAILLEVCRRHVNPSGVVLIQRYRDGWPASGYPRNQLKLTLRQAFQGRRCHLRRVRALRAVRPVRKEDARRSAPIRRKGRPPGQDRSGRRSTCW